MSKQISQAELAEIVSLLLIAPHMVGELDSPQKHCDFIEAIGKTVTEYCGGEVNTVHADVGDGEGHLLSVAPSESLPSFGHCIWGCYDPDGWEDEKPEHFGLPSEARVEYHAHKTHRQNRLQALSAEWLTLASPHLPLTFTVTVDAGIVQAVYSSDPRLQHARCTVVDYDRGSDPQDGDNIHAVRFTPDAQEPAHIGLMDVQPIAAWGVMNVDELMGVAEAE